MVVRDLIAFLQQGLPLDLEIWYEDANFGGASEEFTSADISSDGRRLLIRSPYWTPCDD